MTFFIDLAILAIVAFCTWRGYKNGLMRGVFGVVMLIVSIVGANIAAKAYSEEFTDMLKPFIGGVVENTLSGIIEEGIEPDFSAYMGVLNTGMEDFGTAYNVLREIGLPAAPAARVAEQAIEALEALGSERGPVGVFAEIITDKLSSSLAYIAVFGIAFALLAIISTVIGNMIGFVFSLPGLKLVDVIAGAGFGLFKGLIIVYSIAAVIRYVGLFAQSTLAETAILNHMVNNNPIANMLGI